MNNTKTTKRALLSSVVAMLVCITMLIGTTFAWFTDKVTSSGNIIKSGRLDISATFQNTDANGTISYDVPGFTRTADNKIKFGDAKTDINENNKIIDEQLWEPGAVGAKLITVNNDGNLAAKIMLNFNVNDGGLQNALWYDFIMVNGNNVVGTFTEREMSTLTTYARTVQLPLMPKDENCHSVSFILVYGMKEEAGNEYQDKSFSADVTIFATQYTHESDSFDDQYDTNATYLNTDAQGNYLISNADELVYFAKSVNVDRQDYTGKTVKLTADIDLAGKIWIPVGQTGATQFQGVFDGQGKTIKNMTVNNPSESENVSSGFFGWIENTDGVVISNVKFENANVTGSHYVGVVTGYLSGTISGCEVNNSTVIGINMNNEANGDKIGGIVGYVNAGNVTNNKVTNSTVSGNRDIGGIAGAVVTGVDSFNNNSVSDTTITYETDKSYASAGEIVSGRTGFAPDATNTAINCEVGRTVYGLEIIPNGENSKIIVNSKEGLLNLTKLFNDWSTLFTDGNGNEYSNYYNGSGIDYYYSSYWTISLAADIDLNNATIAPIALNFPTSTGPLKFEGNGKTISNAKIVTDANTENSAGLFDAKGVVMKNLKLDSIHVTGSNVGNSTAGILAGSTNMNVNNITVTNSSVTGGKYTGGVVGYGYNNVTNCSLTNVTVKGGYKLGGLIGYICASGVNTSDVTGNTLTNCTVNGIGGGIFASGKNEYIIGKVVGNYNCNGTCNNNTITDMTTSATENIGKIESGKNVTQ